jgi:hypothetical protein
MPNVEFGHMTRVRGLRALASFCAVVLVVAACSFERPVPEMRLVTDDYAIRITFEPMPPRAIEETKFRVVVRDKETGQPIEGGQGRIFATNEDAHSIDNGLTPGAELGTYYTTLRFVNAGPWAMGLQFRRDSTQRLQRTNDWMQDVLPDSGPP